MYAEREVGMMSPRKFVPKSIHDLPQDVQAIAIAADTFKRENDQLFDAIDRLGGAVDINTARIEHLLYTLQAVGVLDEVQLWEIQLDWEKTLQSQLKPIVEKLAEKRREAEKQAMRPQLIIPG